MGNCEQAACWGGRLFYKEKHALGDSWKLVPGLCKDKEGDTDPSLVRDGIGWPNDPLRIGASCFYWKNG